MIWFMVEKTERARERGIEKDIYYMYRERKRERERERDGERFFHNWLVNLLY